MNANSSFWIIGIVKFNIERWDNRFWFQSIMQVLAKEEENFNNLEKDETRMDIEQASLKFLDIARQLESFFLQKRFVLSALKPELILKEVSSYTFIYYDFCIVFLCNSYFIILILYNWRLFFFSINSTILSVKLSLWIIKFDDSITSKILRIFKQTIFRNY